MMEKRRLVFETADKKIFTTDKDGILVREFGDAAPASDSAAAATINQKGICNNKISSACFQMLEKRGVATHFIKQAGDRDMLVRRMKLLPLRVVCRNIAAGRAAERMALSEGEVLPFPIIEFHIDDNAVRALSQDAEQIQIATEISEGEVSILRAKTVEINCLLKDFFEEKELVLVDFSLVFGRDDSNRIRVGDEISPDTCRLWDRTTHEKLDKDRFRRDMAGAESAYREVLKRVTGETV